MTFLKEPVCSPTKLCLRLGNTVWKEWVQVIETWNQYYVFRKTYDSTNCDVTKATLLATVSFNFEPDILPLYFWLRDSPVQNAHSTFVLLSRLTNHVKKWMSFLQKEVCHGNINNYALLCVSLKVYFWCQVSVILLDFVINLFCLHTVTTYVITWLLLNWISLKQEKVLPKKKHCPFFNPLAPGNFAKKCLLKHVKPFLGHCLVTNNRKCPKRCLQVEH